jgi:hypothetical protein
VMDAMAKEASSEIANHDFGGLLDMFVEDG